MSKNKSIVKDANGQLQEWIKKGVKADEQIRQVELWLKAAKPFIVYWAEEIGQIENLTEKTDALNDFFKNGVVALSADDRAGFKDALCDALRIKSTQWTDRLKALNGSVKKKGDDDDEPIFTTGGWIKHHLVELFYKPNEFRTYLAVRYPDGQVSDLMEKVMIDGRKYVPIYPTSVILKGIVSLPTELGEEMSEDELLAITRLQINRYFDFGGDDFFSEVSPLYVPFTYIYDGFMEVSYFRALGDYGTGKTRFLKTIGKICYRPIYMSGGSSAASIYHLLDLYRGTLVLNEGDFTNSDEASIIAKILNGGTENGESITKMRGTMEKMEVEAYNVFGPKVIATRKEFNDYAIKSRCLTMDMVPMVPHPGIPQSLPPEKELQDLHLRNLWTTFRMKNAQENVKVDESQIDRSLEPRLNQITLSLMATIKDEKTKAKIQEFLKKYNETERGDRYSMFSARVLEGLVLAWAWGPVSDRPEDEMRIHMKDIALAINIIMDHQKMQLGEDEDKDEDDKEDEKKGHKKTRSRKVSDVFRKFLNIKTLRATDGLPKYKGTFYVDMEIEGERVKSLCVRWGVEWREKGSVTENTKDKLAGDDLWMLKPKEISVDFLQSSPETRQLREEWQAMKLKSEDE